MEALLNQSIDLLALYEGGQKELTFQTPSGRVVELITAPYVRREHTVLHTRIDQDGIRYDIPLDGSYNVLLFTAEPALPLAVLSIEFQDMVPTITMIQKVKATKEMDLLEQQGGPGLYDQYNFGPLYETIHHPLRDLIQGEDRIQWEKLLIDIAIEAVQAVYLNPGCIPIGATDTAFSGIERQKLMLVIRSLRNKKIRYPEELIKKFPGVELPICWEKLLSSKDEFATKG